MTREEAIEVLEIIKEEYEEMPVFAPRLPALKYAIEALKQPGQIPLSDKVGEEIDDKYKYVAGKLDQLEEKIRKLEKDVHRLQMGFPICWT